MTEYLNLAEFYNADPRRASSREADYGIYWVADASREFWRVSYIEKTGEVYAQERLVSDRVRVLGIVPPDEGPMFYKTLEILLADWAYGGVKSLSWIEERLKR